jgi:hypothetical protein
VKKKSIETKAARQLGRMRHPKVEKNDAKKTSTPRARSAALSMIENHIRVLKLKLTVAFDSQSGDRSPKYERARYAHALKGISDFLKEIGIVSYQKRFYRLALALDDLNRGTVDPLLEPIKTGGAKDRNVSWVWCARAQVSVGILALLKVGLTRRAAAQQAARKFPKIEELAGVSRKNPSSTATKILSWLDDFNKGARSKIKNPQALAMFASGQQEIEKLPKDSGRLQKTANRMFASALELMLRD